MKGEKLTLSNDVHPLNLQLLGTSTDSLMNPSPPEYEFPTEVQLQAGKYWYSYDSNHAYIWNIDKRNGKPKRVITIAERIETWKEKRFKEFWQYVETIP